MKDLIILTADKNFEYLLKGLLPKVNKTENTIAFTFDIRIHQYRDAGVLNGAHDFLRPFCGMYKYALIIFDKDGCGRDTASSEQVEIEVENKLSINGWEDRAKAIVVDPEIENWMWVKPTHIQYAISWNFEIDIYDWLHNEGLKDPNQSKPIRPKEALEAALKRNRTPRSSSIYLDLATKASYLRCIDPAFIKMTGLLKQWFAQPNPQLFNQQ